MKNKEQITLGFSNADEIQLYQDVCQGRIKTLGNNVETPEYKIITKQQYVKIIKYFGLEDALNAVKEMSRLDRLIYLYNYNSNIISIYKGMNELVDARVKQLYSNNQYEQGRNVFKGEIAMNQYKRLASDARNQLFDIAMSSLESNEKMIFLNAIDSVNKLNNNIR